MHCDPHSIVTQLRPADVIGPDDFAACRFYFNGRWNMSNWAAGFMCSALTLGALIHHSMAGPDATLSKVLIYIGLFLTTNTNIVCFGHFIRDVFMQHVFTAEKHLKPLQFMKLCHEGIRCAHVFCAPSLCPGPQIAS